MPLLRNQQLPNGIWLGLWKIEEDPAFFEQLLDLSLPEQQQLSTLKGRRRIEWLASRWLLHLMSNRTERGIVFKDEFGKPHLSDSKWHISLSHTNGYAAVIAAERLVGVDIQVRVNKITRIAHKFIGETELPNIAPHRAIDFLHIYWGIKECMYKAYGRRELDYKKHLFVHAFNLEEQRTSATIQLDQTLNYQAYFELRSEFILTYVIKT